MPNYEAILNMGVADEEESSSEQSSGEKKVKSN
jgi:hypothetical protein